MIKKLNTYSNQYMYTACMQQPYMSVFHIALYSEVCYDKRKKLHILSNIGQMGQTKNFMTFFCTIFFDHEIHTV